MIWNRQIDFSEMSGGLKFYGVDSDTGFVVASAYQWDRQPSSIIHLHAAVTIYGGDVILREDQMLVKSRDLNLDVLVHQIKKTLAAKGYKLSILQSESGVNTDETLSHSDLV